MRKVCEICGGDHRGAEKETHLPGIACQPATNGPFSNSPVAFEPRSAARQNSTISCMSAGVPTPPSWRNSRNQPTHTFWIYVELLAHLHRPLNLDQPRVRRVWRQLGRTALTSIPRPGSSLLRRPAIPTPATLFICKSPPATVRDLLTFEPVPDLSELVCLSFARACPSASSSAASSTGCPALHRSVIVERLYGL